MAVEGGDHHHVVSDLQEGGRRVIRVDQPRAMGPAATSVPLIRMPPPTTGERHAGPPTRASARSNDVP